jgi:integrase
MKALQSCFANYLTDFITLRRKLGCQFREQARILAEFDGFVARARHDGVPTTELAFDFATADPGLAGSGQKRRFQLVRQFYDYLATFEPRTPILDPRELRSPRTRSIAHIYAVAELGRLLQEARTISRRNAIRGITLHAIVGLAASTGLRVGEIVRLDRTDVNLETGVLTLRRSKFAKDRLVPVHPSTLEALRRYASVRDARYSQSGSAAFFLTLRGERFARGTLEGDFCQLTRCAGLRRALARGPRFHDLRHTFAVRRLVAWYEEGADVNAMLPVLATYMGHVHYTHTAYYLQATAELLGIAADRFQRSLHSGEVDR